MKINLWSRQKDQHTRTPKTSSTFSAPPSELRCKTAKGILCTWKNVLFILLLFKRRLLAVCLVKISHYFQLSIFLFSANFPIREKKSPATERCLMGKMLCLYLIRLQNQVQHRHHFLLLPLSNPCFSTTLFQSDLSCFLFFQNNRTQMTELLNPIPHLPEKKIWWLTFLI